MMILAAGSLATAASSLVSGLLAAAKAGMPWMPVQASGVAPAVDLLFNVILAIATFFFLLIFFLVVLFAVKYRRRPGREDSEPTADHNTPLEITWSVIPLLIVFVIFAWGFVLYLDMYTAPAEAYEIQVVGRQWNWVFTYPGGQTSSELHIPVDRMVRLVMTSDDVIHSFYIPAFRVKKDVVPGRYSKIWFQATDTGEYPVYCAEYCGTAHSDMLTMAHVHEPGGLERWLAEAAAARAAASPAEAGADIFKAQGCGSCHSVDGKPGIGPTFKGLFGHTVPLASGSAVVVDENYIRKSLLDPQADVVAGFQPVMPTYQGRLQESEITALIEYIKTLKEQ
jgi:cytochrome c oxidase subunit II